MSAFVLLVQCPVRDAASPHGAEAARFALYKGMQMEEFLDLLYAVFPQLKNHEIHGLVVPAVEGGSNVVVSIKDALENINELPASVSVAVDPSGLYGRSAGQHGFNLPERIASFDLSKSQVVRVSDPVQVSEMLRSAGNSLVVLEFFQKWNDDCERLAPYFHYYSAEYLRNKVVFIDIDYDEFREFCVSVGVSVVPSYHFFIQGHRVATLEIPEPEHLESLISIPFRAHYSLERDEELPPQIDIQESAESKYHLQASQILFNFVKALETSPDPIISAEESEYLQSLVANRDQQLLGALDKYQRDDDLASLVETFVQALAPLRQKQILQLQDSFHPFCDELFKQGWIDAEVHKVMVNLCREKNMAVLSAYFLYLQDSNIKTLVDTLYLIYESETSSSYISELKATKIRHFRLQMILYLQSEGFLSQETSFEVSKLVETNNADVENAFKSYSNNLNFQWLADDLKQALINAGGEIKDDDSEDEDEADTEAFYSDHLSLKNHKLESIVHEISKKNHLHPEDLTQVIRMILNEDDLVLAAFEIFEEEKDYDELVETLQCIATLHGGVEHELQGIIDTFALDVSLDHKQVDSLKHLAQTGNDVLYASYSLYQEDRNWPEFKDTLSKLVAFAQESSKGVLTEKKEESKDIKEPKKEINEVKEERTEEPAKPQEVPAPSAPPAASANDDEDSEDGDPMEQQDLHKPPDVIQEEDEAAQAADNDENDSDEADSD